MFSLRKNRSQRPNPHFNFATADPNAATAALSAFNRTGSSASLSAAAAAAALKARPMTPTNVAGVQTKRTLRRASSISSTGTVPELGGLGRPGLQRRESSTSSMSERTFRSLSPHRSSSIGGIPRNSYQSGEMTPPVPAIPEVLGSRGNGDGHQTQKPKSLGMVSTPFRTASQKESDEASGAWFGGAKVGNASNVRTSDVAMTTPAPQDNDGRPNSRSSTNFSYPARSRIGSPPPFSPTFAREDMEPRNLQSPPPEPQSRRSKRSSTISPQQGGSVRGGSVSSTRPSSILSDQSLVYDPNSRRMVPEAALLARESPVRIASEARPKKKKQSPARAGSHLAGGSMSRSHGTAVDPVHQNEAQQAATAASLRSYREEHHDVSKEEPAEYEYSAPETESEVHKPQPRQRTESQPAMHAPTLMSPASNVPEVFRGQSPAAGSTQGGLVRKPSVVKEEEEPESNEEDFSSEIMDQPTASAALDTVPIKQSISPGDATKSPQREKKTYRLDSSVPLAAPAALPAPVASTSRQQSFEPTDNTVEGRQVSMESRETQAIRRDSRNHSNSPVRIARFGPVQDNLVVRHSPPARSISPRKSAMKQQSPSRGASPADDTSEASGYGQQETLVPRKRSVRVSFDDENTVVVGHSAPADHSDDHVQSGPQNVKRVPWYSSIVRGRRKDVAPLEEDELMKPRPALPTFGSVRERKPSPPTVSEERPLVRPHEPTYSPASIDSPSTAQNVSNSSGTENVGQSSDHTVGGLLQDQVARNAANISKFREPLPPVVTSREEHGYVSDTSSDSQYYEEANVADPPKLALEESQISQASTLIAPTEGQPKPLNGSATTVPQDAIPSISITQPSLGPADNNKRRSAYLGLPGGFPETESEFEDTSHTPVISTPERLATFEPVVQVQEKEVTPQTTSTVITTHPAIQDLTDESDENSLYSDAYEDLSDIDGDGFQSLDAVVESPVNTPSPKADVTRVPGALRAEVETPTPRPPKRELDISNPPASWSNQSSIPTDEWEAAKAYWRSLTADKRAQLEKEAAEEAGEEGDLEEVNQDTKKPRRKKSVDQRNAEKKAIKQQKAIDLDRIYMIKPGAKAEEYSPGMKATSRGQQEPTRMTNEAAPRLRKSMRGPDARQQRGPSASTEGGTRMRQSMRSNGHEQAQARPSAMSEARPMSYPPPGATPPISMGHTLMMSDKLSQQNSAQPASGKPTSSIQLSLKRHGSDSSASSFRRTRSSSQGFRFRKTMRSASQSTEIQQSEKEMSSRLSMRSMSPGRSSGLRTTLRGNSEPEKRSRFSGSFGFRPGKMATGKSKKTSRFGDDSSDENEGVARPFRSRFDDDSSDEDMVPQPLPALSIPKTMRAKGKAAASPPLPEEEELSEEAISDDEKRFHVAAEEGLLRSQTGDNLGASSLRNNRSGRGDILNSQTMPSLGQMAVNGRPTTGHGSRRSSFISGLWRKKDRSDKISRPDPTESAARRNTDLERSTSELNAVRTNSLSGQYPKLQKRVKSLSAVGNTPTRTESWPLPDEKEENIQAQNDNDTQQGAARDVLDEKVVVAGGPPVASFSLISKDNADISPATRPGLLQRRTLSTQGTIGTGGVGHNSLGKKKFSALRRMFKLDD